LSRYVTGGVVDSHRLRLDEEHLAVASAVGDADQRTGLPETRGEIDTGVEFGLGCILDGVASLIANRED